MGAEKPCHAVVAAPYKAPSGIRKWGGVAARIPESARSIFRSGAYQITWIILNKDYIPSHEHIHIHTKKAQHIEARQ